MRTFFKNDDAYLLVLSLLVLPIFLGFGLIVIDIGRGNNAQSDLQAAADAVALAGARELDGSTDAITDAKAAMAKVTNTVSMLAHAGSNVHIDLTYADASGNEFSVFFLTEIPAADTTPIDAIWLSNYSTTEGELAEYVYVSARSRDLDTFFINPRNLLPSSVAVGAVAVAQYSAAICNMTPLYICNPFENVAGYSGPGLATRFAEGALHGRLLRLHPKGSTTHQPGNFGFLQVEADNGNTSASARAINEIFAGRTNDTCHLAGKVTTKPGAAVSIRTGINTRFDQYDGMYSSWQSNPDHNNYSFSLRPSYNVRKGYSYSGNACNASLDTSTGTYYGYPDNPTMLEPGLVIPGATVAAESVAGSNDWDIASYLSATYGGAAPAVSDVTSAFVGMAPSRYDLYLHEINTHINGGGTDLLSIANPIGETGLPQCGPSKNPISIDPVEDPDPRVIHAAIIDCAAQESEGGGINVYDVIAYARLFLVRPMEGNSAGPSSTTTGTDGNTIDFGDATIDVEIVDITGPGGNGALENFIREESFLIR